MLEQWHHFDSILVVGQSRHDPFRCPAGKNCHTVSTSRYNDPVTFTADLRLENRALKTPDHSHSPARDRSMEIVDDNSDIQIRMSDLISNFQNIEVTVRCGV